MAKGRNRSVHPLWCKLPHHGGLLFEIPRGYQSEDQILTISHHCNEVHIHSIWHFRSFSSLRWQQIHCWRNPRITTYLYSPTEPHYTHGAIKLSPAELLMGRRLRTDVPQTSQSLTPQWPYLSQFQKDDHTFKDKQKHDFDRHHRVRDLPELPDSTDVGWQPTITLSQVELSHQLQLPVHLLYRHQVVTFNGIVVTSMSSWIPIWTTRKQAKHRTESKNVPKQEHRWSLQTDCDWHPRKGRCSITVVNTS